jgi:DNA-directed RNA polymerase subunit beta'
VAGTAKEAALPDIGGDGVTAGGAGMTDAEFQSLANDAGSTVLDNLMLDTLFKQESDQIDGAIDRLDDARDPAGIYTDPEPQDETDRSYFENAAPNDEAEARAEHDAAEDRDDV